MWSLFKDKNEINEKNVVGFASFVVMCLFAVADLLTSILADKDLIINEVVYNSFVWVTLGCFGISSFEKVKKNNLLGNLLSGGGAELGKGRGGVVV